MKAPQHPDEARRIAALRALEILDTAPEPDLDGIVQLASRLADAPIALVSLVDEDRQWFKAKCGLSVSETDRDVAFCAHAILDPSQPLIVPDATKDARFKDNALVTGAPHIRFYAGFPVLGPQGLPMGTICIIDMEPRELTTEQREAMEILAVETTNALRLRALQNSRIHDAKREDLLLETVASRLEAPVRKLQQARREDGWDTAAIEAAADALTLLARELGGSVQRLDPSRPVTCIGANLEHALHDVLAREATQLEKARRKLAIAGDLETTIWADAKRLAEVVEELLVNARLHGQGDVRVTVRDAGYDTQIDVADDGPGFSPEALARELPKGLDVARQIMRHMGGDLHASQTPDGPVVSLSITKPIAAPARAK